MRDLKELLDLRIALFQIFRDSCHLQISALAEGLIHTFRRGNKLLICGNGGSAADSQHIAAEFISSFANGLARRSLPAISLTVDTSVITAISNDFNYDSVFSRQIEGLGAKNDAILILSTSGRSANCLQAVKTARKLGLQIFALTQDGSPLHKESDLAIGVPSLDTQLIQECHIIAYHLIAQLVDDEFSKEKTN